MALRTSYLSHSHFGRLASAGVTATFALYVLINGSMVMGLAPVVGVPMPLLSYGGTVMLTVMVGFGLVMAVRVHRYSEVTSGKGSLVSVIATDWPTAGPGSCRAVHSRSRRWNRRGSRVGAHGVEVALPGQL